MVLEHEVEVGLNELDRRLEKVRDVFEEMNILITGGCGFIGSWMCDLLIRWGSNILCIDNLSTGKIDYIDHLMKTGRFKLINKPVEKVKEVEFRPDVVIHMAARASPEDYMMHPVETILANTLGTYNMLEIARKHDAIFLFTSTSEVYGDPEDEYIPTPEKYWGRVNPIGPRSCYDESKRLSEAMCMAYHREYSLDVRITRIFNSYGPRLRWDGAYARVIPRFIYQALMGQPITVHGDGSQTRSFTYIVDTIEAHILVMTDNRARGEVFNIGNNREISILELARIIKELTKSSSEIVFKPQRPDDPKRRCPDISKIANMLGWKPRTELREGLMLTISWIKSHLTASH